MLETVIHREFKKAYSRKWDKIYIAVDFHDTIFKSSYHHSGLEFLPYAQEALQYLSTRKDIVLIGWSSLTVDVYRAVYEPVFIENKIYFKFLNENPLERNTHYADFSNKFYFNILIDDKSGWDAYADDWKKLLNTFKNIPILGESATGY